MPKAIEGVEWNKLQMLYMTGQASCRELSERFGVSIQAIARRCTREGWRTEKERCVQKMSEKTIETVVDRRLALIKEHEAKAYRVSEKLISAVESNHDSMPGGLLDCTMVNTLANALKVSVGVARLSLGCVDPSQQVNVTGTVVHSHEHAIQVLESCKRIAAEQGDNCTKTIDLPALLEIVNRKDP